MSETTASTAKKRPEFYNIDGASLISYRWPIASIASGMHRVSGAILFFLMPFIIWMFDNSISSEISFLKFKAAFNEGMLGLPGFIWKLVVLGIIWASLHHFIAGLRHLWMDTHHEHVTKDFGRQTAATVIVLTLALTVVLGAKLFGLY
ncbi:MAG: succinate dehydrogenase, cytochrome b556 subunit [Comamonadaceae bacterium CG_4_9_14_3_um_filter_60_33]|nr:MAG: succinate dehydrogenase, cytochrome b556 subunit [Comamonadaceae bacterium CG2_30_59_20]PIY28971.1 MAG: succinate dehydrogenase, cytochrome b556 subunit [Comamonadaceae bacterium CG_4_10_14_3_um_filter_60_42]PJB46056.1 MAG: succinate dehydrogenase, cytochrome b556 subunit [Comamonadaceae bacterium CG_4_9_14_3_um_filter_60_33]